MRNLEAKLDSKLRQIFDSSKGSYKQNHNIREMMLITGLTMRCIHTAVVVAMRCFVHQFYCFDNSTMNVLILSKFLMSGWSTGSLYFSYISLISNFDMTT